MVIHKSFPLLLLLTPHVVFTQKKKQNGRVLDSMLKEEMVEVEVEDDVEMEVEVEVEVEVGVEVELEVEEERVVDRLCGNCSFRISFTASVLYVE